LKQNPVESGHEVRELPTTALGSARHCFFVESLGPTKNYIGEVDSLYMVVQHHNL